MGTLVNEARSSRVEKLALSPNEAAEALGISRRTLDDYSRKGLIPRKRVGKRVLFPVEGLRAFLNSQEETTQGIAN